jgi:hypothetical protein
MKCNPICRFTPVQDNTALRQEKVSRARIHRNQRKRRCRLHGGETGSGAVPTPLKKACTRHRSAKSGWVSADTRQIAENKQQN